MIDNTNLQCYQIEVIVRAVGVTLSSVKDPSCISQESVLRYPAISGIITQTGNKVVSFAEGDRVAGLLSCDSHNLEDLSTCVLEESEAVKLPDRVSFMLGVSALSDGVSAYTALHYSGKLTSGDSLLITDGALGWRSLAIQLAQSWGAKVLSTARTDEEKTYLENLPQSISQLVTLNSENQTLYGTVKEETGGLGVDVFIDNGVRMYTDDELDSPPSDQDSNLIRLCKHDVMSCLAIGARWVTCQGNLQLDPPNCEMLMQKAASVNFFNDQIWTLAGVRRGHLQHILHEIVDKLANGELKPNITNVINGVSPESLQTLTNLSPFSVGKTVVVLE